MSTAAPPLAGIRLRIGVVLALLLLIAGFISVTWTPHDLHLLGTDEQGRDLLSLAMRSLLTSFVVAGVAVAIGLCLGVPLAIAASATGVWGKRLLLGGSGFFISLSAVGLAVLLSAFETPPAPTAMLAIGLFSVGVIAQATHTALAPYRDADHIAAARLAGLKGWSLARRHMLPDLLPRLVADALSLMATAVLLETGLSFVGLGVEPPGSSFGIMLRDGLPMMNLQTLPVLVPGGALFLVALSLNLAATGIRHTLPGGRYAA